MGKKLLSRMSIFASRLTTIRTEAGLTQSDLAKIIRDLSSTSAKVSEIAVSSYETGSRTPTLPTVIFIAQYFDVSVDWLCGLTDDRNGFKAKDEKKEETKSIFNDIPELEIRTKDLYKYDKMPVYITSINDTIEPGWAIINYKEKVFTMADGTRYYIDNSFKYYKAVPSNANYTTANEKKSLTYLQLLESDEVWVEMNTSDGFIRGLYNGWYIHNKDKTALVSPDNSRILSYDRLGYTYNAYSL